MNEYDLLGRDVRKINVNKDTIGGVLFKLEWVI